MNTAARTALAPGSAALATAARALNLVLEEGCTAEEALRRVPGSGERAAVRAIHSGTLRWYLSLSPLLDALLQPGQSMAPLVRALIVTALHQLEHSRAAPHSVVNIAVDAARLVGQRGASGFVNAMLRRFLRERSLLLARLARDEAAATAHPAWLLEELRRQHPDAVGSIIEAGNENPSLVLRVNLSRIPRAQMQQRLTEAGIMSEPGMGDASLVLERACDVDSLPGFAAGLVSVQDAGAQQAAALLDAQPGMRVLDACAAPGGKAGHILERTTRVMLTALDVDGSRLARVAENLQRLGLEARLVEADLLAEGWWDNQKFERILLDVPCSGTGVIRRHPDIKLLRRPADITGFARQQAALLRRAAGMLTPGGLLVYATCSILQAENEAVVDAFLAGHPGFSRVRPDLRLLPKPRAAGAATLTDGFYYACLQMKADA